MKLYLNRSLLFVIVFLWNAITTVTFAGPTDPPPPTPPGPPGLPIDGGVLLLFIVSLVYGLYKIHEFNKNQKSF